MERDFLFWLDCYTSSACYEDSAFLFADTEYIKPNKTVIC